MASFWTDLERYPSMLILFSHSGGPGGALHWTGRPRPETHGERGHGAVGHAVAKGCTIVRGKYRLEGYGRGAALPDVQLGPSADTAWNLTCIGMGLSD